MAIQKCRLCSKEFKFKRGNHRYCYACGYKNCFFCKKDFLISTVAGGRKEGRKHIFCSRICRDTATKLGLYKWKLSEATRKRMGLSRRGEKNYWWKGGISKFRDRLHATFEYEEWRKAVFKRDDYICQMCNQVGGILNADHIKPYALIRQENDLQSVEEALNCSELWNLDNGRTLCVSCHRNTETYGRRVYKYL